MKNEKMHLILEALDVFEKGKKLLDELNRKKENNEEMTIADIREITLLAIRRDEIVEILRDDKEMDNEKI